MPILWLQSYKQRHYCNEKKLINIVILSISHFFQKLLENEFLYSFDSIHYSVYQTIISILYLYCLRLSMNISPTFLYPYTLTHPRRWVHVRCSDCQSLHLMLAAQVNKNALVFPLSWLNCLFISQTVCWKIIFDKKETSEPFLFCSKNLSLYLSTQLGTPLSTSFRVRTFGSFFFSIFEISRPFRGWLCWLGIPHQVSTWSIRPFLRKNGKTSKW